MRLRIIRDLAHCPASAKGAVVALGNFDGVHRGHQEILSQCVASAQSYGVSAAVMTFEPHPREFFTKTKSLRLIGLHQKIRLFQRFGIDTLLLVRFNAAFASMSPETFVRDVLVGGLAVKQVVTGYDFAFGKGREGSTDYLAAKAREAGFGYTACPPVQDEAGHTISSTAIRALLARGDVRQAGALLGHPYLIEGRVRHGYKRGRELGFPTANISLHGMFKPRLGIYAARLHVDGAILPAAASIGINPTFDLAQPLLEVHVLDRTLDLYGKRVQVECVSFLRDEEKFPSPDALKAQIAKDCLQVKTLLARECHG